MDAKWSFGSDTTHSGICLRKQSVICLIGMTRILFAKQTINGRTRTPCEARSYSHCHFWRLPNRKAPRLAHRRSRLGERPVPYNLPGRSITGCLRPPISRRDTETGRGARLPGRRPGGGSSSVIAIVCHRAVVGASCAGALVGGERLVGVVGIGSRGVELSAAPAGIR